MENTNMKPTQISGAHLTSEEIIEGKRQTAEKKLRLQQEKEQRKLEKENQSERSRDKDNVERTKEGYEGRNVEHEKEFNNSWINY